MTRIPSQASPPAGADAHLEWRRRRLLVAGFDEPLATWLAGDGGVDLHELLTLLDLGCPPVLAARILAPIDLPGT
jgi:hypothetical protein